MNKQEFLAQLRKALSGFPQDDIEEHLAFYSEMIEDRMEEGLSETEAVSAAGSVTEIAAQAVADTPFMKIAKERMKHKRRLNAVEITLLILGSPIWLSLCIAVFSVILSIYAVLWSVIISLWAVFLSLAVCTLGGVIGCVFFSIGSNGVSGIAALAAGFICAGLSVFMFYGCKAVTKGTLVLTKKTAILIKNCFIKKEKA